MGNWVISGSATPVPKKSGRSREGVLYAGAKLKK